VEGRDDFGSAAKIYQLSPKQLSNTHQLKQILLITKQITIMIAKNKKQGQKAEDVIYHASITSTKKLDYNSAISTLTSAGTPYETAVTIVRDAFDAAPETSSEAENKIPLSTQIVRSCLEGCEYLIDPEKYGKGWVKLLTGEVIAVDSPYLPDHIASAWFIMTELTVNKTVMSEVISHIEMKCSTQGSTVTTFKRIGKDENGCNQIATHNKEAGYPVIHFEDGDWKMVSPLELKTSAYPTNLVLNPLPVPVKGGGAGGLKLLWKHIKLANNADRRIYLAWLLTTMQYSSVFPGLEFLGDAGSIKTTSSKRTQSLIDPSSGGEVKPESSTSDIGVMTDCHHVLILDNVSHIDKSSSDYLCKCATGSTDTGRKLYTNGGVYQRKLLCSLIINGITSAITEPDLMERTVSLTLEKITEYKSINECDDEWKKDYPVIFNMLVELLAVVIKEVKTISLPCSWRMVDFVMVGEALNRLMPKEEGVPSEEGGFRDMMVKINHNRAVRNSEGSLAISTLIKYAIKRTESSNVVFEGFVEELLEILKNTNNRTSGFPVNGRGMRGLLDRNREALGGIGFSIVRSDKQYAGKHKITITIDPIKLKELRDGSSLSTPDDNK